MNEHGATRVHPDTVIAFTAIRIVLLNTFFKTQATCSMD